MLEFRSCPIIFSWKINRKNRTQQGGRLAWLGRGVHGDCGLTDFTKCCQAIKGRVCYALRFTRLRGSRASSACDHRSSSHLPLSAIVSSAKNTSANRPTRTSPDPQFSHKRLLQITCTQQGTGDLEYHLGPTLTGSRGACFSLEGVTTHMRHTQNRLLSFRRNVLELERVEKAS